MKLSDAKENFEKDSSWISITSLKKAASISTIIENYQSEHTMPVNLSILSDIKEKLNESTACSNINTSLTTSRSKSNFPSYASLLKKILFLNQELGILSHLLKSANKEIERLNKLLEVNQQESTIKLQLMQEKHEKRMQKTKADLDFLLKDMNMKSAALLADEFIKKHEEELEGIKEIYEKRIEQIRNFYEHDMIVHEIEQKKQINELSYELNLLRKMCGKEDSRKAMTNRDLKEEESWGCERISAGNEGDGEFSLRNLRNYTSANRNAVKIAMVDFFERISYESSASTRESR